MYLARDAAGPIYIEDAALVLDGFQLSWVGAAKGSWEPGATTGETRRYCRERTPAYACTNGVKTYRSIERKDLYPGIDLILYERDHRMEYDLRVAPHADPRQIRLRFTGSPVELDEAGTVRGPKFVHRAPVASQKGQPISAQLRRLGANEFGFHLGAYDSRETLLIDPIIERQETVGGGSEDRMLGSVGTFRWGVTKSGDWSGRSSWDVFVQAIPVGGFDYTTVFWGGDGDEEIAGFWADTNNNTLHLAGSTNSANALSISNGIRQPARAAQGWDGFVLEFRYASLLNVAIMGGPGDDRVHAALPLNPGFLLAGETTQPEWPNATVIRAGPGGGIDAFVAIHRPHQLRIWTAGGPGTDRCRGLLAARDSWLAAGETDSPDFAGRGAFGDTDLWLARLHPELAVAEPSIVQRWGGTGHDRWGGIAFQSENGLFLAGATESPALPGARNQPAGRRDGFLASFDTSTLTPIVVAFLGGEGDDEISGLQLTAGDLYLAGSTDSPSLPFPGESLQAQGTRDAMFLHVDQRTFPTYAHRHPQGRWYSVATIPGKLGTVRLNGETNGDATQLQLRFPLILAPRSPVFLGRDLQLSVPISTPGEPAPDGLIIATSSDPTRLQLARPGHPDPADSVALEPTGSEAASASILLYALAADGLVDVTLRARAGQSWAERRVAVRLTPTGLYLAVTDAPRESSFLTLPPTTERLRVFVYAAPVRPDGVTTRNGFALRPGVTAMATVRTANAAQTIAPSVELTAAPSFVDVEFRVREPMVLEPQSDRFEAAPGARLMVDFRRVVTPSAEKWQQAVDHIVELRLRGQLGDRVEVESLDPDLVVVGPSRGRRVDVTLPASSLAVPVLALASQGIARLRVRGTFFGEFYEITHEILLQEFDVVWAFSVPQLLPLGRSALNLAWSTRASVRPGTDFLPTLGLLRSDSPLANLRWRSSRPSVAQVDASGVTGLSAGTTVIEVETPDARFPALRDFRWNLEIVNPRIEFASSEIVLAADATTRFLSNRILFSGTSVRVRTSDANVFRVQNSSGQMASDATYDVRQGPIFLGLEAMGQPGQRAALVFSFPGSPDQTIPVRIGRAVLRPQRNLYTAERRSDRSGAYLRVNWSPVIDGELADVFYPPVFRQARPVRIRSSNQSVCAERPPYESSSSITIDLECTGIGETTLRLESDWPLAAQAPSTVVRIVPSPEEAAVRPPPLRLGFGLQASVFRQWATRFRSSDPEALRVAVSPQDPGQAEAGGTQVWVQGMVAAGQSRLIAEGEGRREEIPVYHFPSTLAARLLDSNLVEGSAVTRSLVNPSISLAILPVMVEPETGSLLDVPRHSASDAPRLRGGWDPFFATVNSSRPSVAELTEPRLLLSEGRNDFRLPLRLRDFGQTQITVTQPEGFATAPAGSLRLTVEPDQIRFQPILLAPDLQTQVLLSNLPADRRITAESLQPEKLELSSQELGPGATQLTLDPPRPGFLVNLFARALPAASPGETLRLRITAEGQPPLEIPVPIGRLRIEPTWDLTRAFFPLGPVNLSFALGPAIGEQRERNWSGRVRPGVTLALDLSSSDPSRLRLRQSRFVFERSFGGVGAEVLRPGTVEVTATSSLPVDNAAARTPVIIAPWPQHIQTTSLLPYLITPWLTLSNPSPTSTTFTLRSEDVLPVLMTISAGSVPRESSLALTLEPNENRTIYAFLNGLPSPNISYRGQVRLSAPDFEDNLLERFAGEATAVFHTSSPVSIARTQPAFEGQIALGSPNSPSLRFPLAIAATFEIRSSNPQVVRGGTVAFAAGESNRSFSLPVVGPGDTVLTLVPPGALSVIRGATLLVSVR